MKARLPSKTFSETSTHKLGQDLHLSRHISEVRRIGVPPTSNGTSDPPIKIDVFLYFFINLKMASDAETSLE